MEALDIREREAPLPVPDGFVRPSREPVHLDVRANTIDIPFIAGAPFGIIVGQGVGAKRHLDVADDVLIRILADDRELTRSFGDTVRRHASFVRGACYGGGWLFSAAPAERQ